MKKNYFLILVCFFTATILSLSGCGVLLEKAVTAFSTPEGVEKTSLIATIAINEKIKIKIQKLKKEGGGFNLDAINNGKYWCSVWTPTYDPATDNAAEIVRYFRTGGIDLDPSYPATTVSEIPIAGLH